MKQNGKDVGIFKVEDNSIYTTIEKLKEQVMQIKPGYWF